MLRLLAILYLSLVFVSHAAFAADPVASASSRLGSVQSLVVQDFSPETENALVVILRSTAENDPPVILGRALAWLADKESTRFVEAVQTVPVQRLKNGQALWMCSLLREHPASDSFFPIIFELFRRYSR